MKKEYNPKKEIEKLCEENKIVFDLGDDKRKGYDNFSKIKKAGKLNLLHNELLKFIKSNKPTDILVVEDFGIKVLREDMEKPKEDKIKEAIRVIADYNHHAKAFIEIQPFFYDSSKMWWIWNDEIKYWEIKDEIDLMNRFDDEFSVYSLTQKTKSEIIEALKRAGRKNIPKPIKKTWIQFKDTIVDIKTGERFKSTSKYFVTNPIPWKLHPENFEETPVMDKIFEEWVGKDYIQTLYEILAYSLLPDYPIHRLFCFIGGGMNGKTCFLRLLNKFVGEKNITSTELDVLLTSRFEITRLHKKLVCIMGETNFSEMNKTSIIKKLTGQDIIGFEYKNKTPFEGSNYAKILIATNNLPTTTDKTVGFYRRWCLIDFPNRFSEQKDILEDIPDEEYESLALKSLVILKNLLEKRRFHNEGDIEERMKRYEDRSDPIEKFLKEFTDDEADGHIFKWEFEKRLNEWCKENRFRAIAENTIGKKMKEKGIETGRVSAEWYENDVPVTKRVRAWLGIKWKSGQGGQDG